MAVISTATVPFAGPSSYPLYMIYPAVPVGFGALGSFDPWPGAGPPTVNYYQRVWSTGTSVWCYYTKTTIDTSPLSGDTTPNWVGSATSPSVVSIF